MNPLIEFALQAVVYPTVAFVAVIWLFRIPSPFPRDVYVVHHKDVEPPHELFQTKRGAEKFRQVMGENYRVHSTDSR